MKCSLLVYFLHIPWLYKFKHFLTSWGCKAYLEVHIDHMIHITIYHFQRPYPLHNSTEWIIFPWCAFVTLARQFPTLVQRCKFIKSQTSHLKKKSILVSSVEMETIIFFIIINCTQPNLKYSIIPDIVSYKKNPCPMEANMYFYKQHKMNNY